MTALSVGGERNSCGNVLCERSFFLLTAWLVQLREGGQSSAAQQWERSARSASPAAAVEKSSARRTEQQHSTTLTRNQQKHSCARLELGTASEGAAERVDRRGGHRPRSQAARSRRRLLCVRPIGPKAADLRSHHRLSHTTATTFDAASAQLPCRRPKDDVPRVSSTCWLAGERPLLGLPAASTGLSLRRAVALAALSVASPD